MKIKNNYYCQNTISKNVHKQQFGMTLELKHHVFFEDYNYKDYSKYYVKDSLGNIHRLW